jgi:hypothetical protein
MGCCKLSDNITYTRDGVIYLRLTYAIILPEKAALILLIYEDMSKNCNRFLLAIWAYDTDKKPK